MNWYFSQLNQIVFFHLTFFNFARQVSYLFWPSCCMFFVNFFETKASIDEETHAKLIRTFKVSIYLIMSVLLQFLFLLLIKNASFQAQFEFDFLFSSFLAAFLLSCFSILIIFSLGCTDGACNHRCRPHPSHRYNFHHQEELASNHWCFL